MSLAITRLMDPSGCSASPRQLKNNQELITNTITRLFRKPENGGNPFLFALCGPKPHYLGRTIHGKPLPTAATDGKSYFWNPDWLESLNPDQVANVMMHESYHDLFFHCAPERAGGYDQFVFNIACDYVVNSVILTEDQKCGRDKKIPWNTVWTGPLGTPIPLQNYLEWIDGTRQDLPQPGCFTDVTMYGRSPESIYDEIRQHQFNSPRRCKEQTGGCGAMSIDPKTGKSIYGDPDVPPAPPYADPNACQKCGCPPNPAGGSMDVHVPSGRTRDEVMGDMMRASEQAESMSRGSSPAAIDDALGRLSKPELRARDIIRHCLAEKTREAGMHNDHSRFRRRAPFIWEMSDETGEWEPKHKMWIPKTHDFKPHWIALLDTSGSMSDADIANGCKELQLVAELGEGTVIPCDATPYWDKATRITSKSDVQRTQIVGRGGTVFEQFFRELPQQPCGRRVDLVVIITDGDCDQIPLHLKPVGADVLWIITNKREFRPNFGRVCQLKPSRL